jgi:hypothetical protein
LHVAQVLLGKVKNEEFALLNPVASNDGDSPLPMQVLLRSKHGWLVVLWVLCTVVAIAGWWMGLAWATVWLVGYAIS